MFAIEARGLSKTYRRWPRREGPVALRGVDLCVEPGTAFGLIGPNGAGKTTFIKALLAVVRPSSGSIRLFGRDPEDPSARKRVGYLPERLYLPGSWMPISFLASVGRLKGLRFAKDELRALLDRVGLGPDSHRRIGGFSKGMKQRLGLAAALLGRPELLVLDEPTDGIDPLGRAEVRRILMDERSRGTTVFLNSHLLSETERICNRVGIIAKGQLVREGTIEKLCTSPSRWIARFAPGAKAEQLLACGFSRLDGSDRWLYASGDEAVLNGAIDRARAAGALLIELAPDSRDLEEVFADAIGAAG